MRVFIGDDEDQEPVEVSPEQVEVEDDDPFLTQDEVDDVVQKRVNRAKRTTREELKNDDEFWQEMAQAHGIELREDGKPKVNLSDDEVQEMRQRISELESEAEEAERLRERIDSVRETELENELLSNADGVKDDMQDVFMSYAKSRFTYDDEYGWVKTNEEGEIEFEGGEPVRPSDFAERTREERPSMFQDPSMQNGPESTPSEGGGSPETVTRSEFEGMSPEKQKEIAQDEGTQIVEE